MNQKQARQLKKMGVFTLSQAQDIGLSQQQVSRLTESEELLRVGRGLYLHSEARVEREIDFAIACAQFGAESVISGLSALFHYDLIDQVPQQVWLLVPSKKTTTMSRYRLMRTKSDLNIGVSVKKSYRIVSMERAIIEGLKYSAKIGERTAIKAAREALRQKKTTMSKIGKAAKELKAGAIVSKYFEAIVA